MEALIFLFLFVAVTAVVLVPLYWRAKERKQVLDIVKLAVEREGPVPVELMQSMQQAFRSRPSISPTHDLRRGFFLLALGAAFITVGLVIYATISPLIDADDFQNFVPFPLIVGSIGILPGFVGLAYLILGYTAKPPKD